MLWILRKNLQHNEPNFFYCNKSEFSQFLLIFFKIEMCAKRHFEILYFTIVITIWWFTDYYSTKINTFFFYCRFIEFDFDVLLKIYGPENMSYRIRRPIVKKKNWNNFLPIDFLNWKYWYTIFILSIVQFIQLRFKNVSNFLFTCEKEGETLHPSLLFSRETANKFRTKNYFQWNWYSKTKQRAQNLNLNQLKIRINDCNSMLHWI